MPKSHNDYVLTQFEWFANVPNEMAENDQFEIIERFAHQHKDAELNVIYKLNECEFRVMPHIGFSEAEIKSMQR